MNFIQLRRSLTYGMLAIVLASSVLLASCGGGGGGGSSQSAGVGGTGIAAGKTTGFGSIYVNGIKFNTDQSTFIVDGDSFPNQLAANLQVGMYVLLRVETLDGNFTGKALEVVYDDEIEGPIETLPLLDASGNKKSFVILGQDIVIDQTTTIFDGTCFDGPGCITQGDVVEISGFRTSPTDIVATYVELKGTLPGTTETELKGSVGAPITPTTFMLGTVTVTYDPSDLPAGGVLALDQLVEVKGNYIAVNSVDATEIEFEQEVFGDDVDDVSLQGVVSNYNPITGEFEIDGLPIDTSQATELSPANVLGLIDDGVEIEVEGDIEGGVFIAEEVELREGQTELRTTVSAIVLPNRFQVEYPGQPLGSGLGTVWINTDGQTLFEDEDDSGGKTPVENFSIDQLALGDFVKVKGIAESGEVTAQIVKRLDPNDSSKLQGAVEAFIRTVPASITILGVEYPIDAIADYEDAAGNTLTKDQFFDQLEVTPNVVVELEDDEPADSDADEVEFDD